MKETSKIETPETDKVVVVQDIKKEIKLLGSQRKIKGLTMFEYNPNDQTLEPAKYKEVKAELQGKAVAIRHKLIYKDGCAYIQALNKRVAFKKLAKAKLIKIK